MVDVNNDGYLDIYVNNDGPTNDEELLSNDLFINNGNLSFSNKARELGVADSGRSVQSVFFDADNDGDLDILLIANETGNSGNKVAGAILRNDGDFTFNHLAYGTSGNQIRRIPSGLFIR